MTSNKKSLKRFDDFIRPRIYCGGDGCSGFWNLECDDINHNDGRILISRRKAEQFLISELNRRDREIADKVFKRIEEKSFSEGSKNKGMIYIDLGVWNELKSKYLSKEEEK